MRVAGVYLATCASKPQRLVSTMPRSGDGSSHNAHAAAHCSCGPVRARLLRACSIMLLVVGMAALPPSMAATPPRDTTTPTSSELPQQLVPAPSRQTVQSTEASWNQCVVLKSYMLGITEMPLVSAFEAPQSGYSGRVAAPAGDTPPSTAPPPCSATDSGCVSRSPLSWMGAADAVSIPLTNETYVWLFGNPLVGTWIPGPPFQHGTRQLAGVTMIHQAAAVVTAMEADFRNGDMTYYWRRALRDGAATPSPTSLFTPRYRHRNAFSTMKPCQGCSCFAGLTLHLLVLSITHRATAVCVNKFETLTLSFCCGWLFVLFYFVFWCLLGSGRTSELCPTFPPPPNLATCEYLQALSGARVRAMSHNQQGTSNGLGPLVVLASRVRPSSPKVWPGFVPVGTSLVVVENADDPPPLWRYVP